MAKTYYSEELVETGVNLYEAVILASRESRRLNQTRLNADLPDGVEKITTVSLGRITDGKIEMTREAETESESEESEEGSA